MDTNNNEINNNIPVEGYPETVPPMADYPEADSPVEETVESPVSDNVEEFLPPEGSVDIPTDTIADIPAVDAPAEDIPTEVIDTPAVDVPAEVVDNTNEMPTDIINDYPEAVTTVNEPPVENPEPENMLPPEEPVEINATNDEVESQEENNTNNNEEISDEINAQEIAPEDLINENYVDEDYQDVDYSEDQTNYNKSINNHVNIVNNYNQNEDMYYDDTESVSSYEEQLNNSEDISFDTQGTSQYQEMQENDYIDSSSYDGMYNIDAQAPEDNTQVNDNYNQNYDEYEQPMDYNQGYNDYNAQPYDNQYDDYNQGYDNYSEQPYDNQGYDQGYNDYNAQSYDNQYDNYNQGYDDYNQPPMDYGQTNNTFINTPVEPAPSFINTTYEPTNDVEIERPSYKPKYGFDKKQKKQSKAYSFGLVFIYVIIFGVIGYIGYSLWVDRSTFYFKKDKMNILVGSTYEQKILVKGKEEEPDKYTWSSENNDVATVDNNGVITAKSEGKTNIVATNRKTKKSNIVSVNVVNLNIKTFAIKPTSKVVIMGKTYTLNPSINGQSSIIVNYIWKSADTSIATVNANGEIKGIKRGHTTVTAYIPNTKFYASVTINVIDK